MPDFKEFRQQRDGDGHREIIPVGWKDREKRKAINVDGTLRIRGADHSFSVKISDIAVGGVKAQNLSRQIISLNMEGIISFQFGKLNRGEVVRDIKVKVAWVKSPFFGLEFRGIDTEVIRIGDSRKTLAEIINHFVSGDEK